MLSNDRNEIYAWDLYEGFVESNFLLAVFPGTLHRLVASPDSPLIFAAGSAHSIYVYDLHTRKLAQILPGHHGAINALACSQDGQYLLSGGNDRTVRIWDIATLKQIASFNTSDSVCAGCFRNQFYSAWNNNRDIVFVIGLDNGDILFWEEE